MSFSPELAFSTTCWYCDVQRQAEVGATFSALPRVLGHQETLLNKDQKLAKNSQDVSPTTTRAEPRPSR